MPDNHADDLTPSEQATRTAHINEREEAYYEQILHLLKEQTQSWQDHAVNIEQGNPIPTDVAEFLLHGYETTITGLLEQVESHSTRSTTTARTLLDKRASPADTSHHAKDLIAPTAAATLTWDTITALARLLDVVNQRLAEAA